MSIPARQPAGTPVGGQFAESAKAAPDAAVALMDEAPIRLPADTPSTEQIHALSTEAWRLHTHAQRARDLSAKLELAAAAAELHASHGVTDFRISVGTDDGEYTYLDSVETADGDTHGDGDVFDAVDQRIIDGIGVSPDLVSSRKYSEGFNCAELIESAPALAKELREALSPAGLVRDRVTAIVGEHARFIGPVPAWPAGQPEPTVGLSLDDSVVNTVVYVGDDEDAYLQVWTEGDQYWGDDQVTLSAKVTDTVPPAAIAEMRTYAKAVHANAKTLHTGVSDAVLTETGSFDTMARAAQGKWDA